MAQVQSYGMCARSCVDCTGIDHHWIPGYDEEWGEAVMMCKHCPAQRPLGGDENPDDADYRIAPENQPENIR